MKKHLVVSYRDQDVYKVAMETVVRIFLNESLPS